jgi:hypothetical protein
VSPHASRRAPIRPSFETTSLLRSGFDLALKAFTGEALRRLGGEAGCTHRNSLISDPAIAGLFHGYLRVREQTRERGVLPVLPASDERTGICAGWRAGGTLATWMEQGRGIAPSRIYPTGRHARRSCDEP